MHVGRNCIPHYFSKWMGDFTLTRRNSTTPAVDQLTTCLYTAINYGVNLLFYSHTTQLHNTSCRPINYLLIQLSTTVSTFLEHKTKVFEDKKNLGFGRREMCAISNSFMVRNLRHWARNLELRSKRNTHGLTHTRQVALYIQVVDTRRRL